ncbi:MAG: hypothetical protein IRY94_01990 [Rhodospirillaceae bacterium]|nr:hypothetical protein [Rhodospirillaceae bacterium]
MQAGPQPWNRLAVIVSLLEHVQPSALGRTALMKCLYLLEAMRGVQLGYHFRLYTYGPFDSDVLDDLTYAERLGAVVSDAKLYSAGYGYEIRPGPKAVEVRDRAQGFLAGVGDDIAWIAAHFAPRSAVELETLSTLVFVDRAASGRRIDLDEIVDRVHGIKPRLSREAILREARALLADGLLKNLR